MEYGLDGRGLIEAIFSLLHSLQLKREIDTSI
jgi:hypothetical protein